MPLKYDQVEPIGTIAVCVRGKRPVWFLVGLLVFVFFVQLIAGFYQQFWNPEFTVMHLPRRTGAGVSGLFWHWNNLAAPVEFEVTEIKKDEMSPSKGAAEKVEAESDGDPREFILETKGLRSKTFKVTVKYFAS